jgi:NAD(P)-dependent dehydrogenase (short-subunit alcohol dehydrogenase family)
MRKIVLTGCSRGLGLALVHEFVAAGHQVAGCSRSLSAMLELDSRYGAPHFFRAVDVSDQDAVAAWAKELESHMGVPDLVINNAAMINEPAPLWQVSVDEFRQLMEVNLVGVHIVTRYLLPPMIKQGRGVLVNLSSGWGRSASAEVAPYCASKWAIEGMTKALAEELPAGLAAVPLSPGVIDTDMLRQAWGEGAGAYRTPSQWASMAAPFILGLSASDNGKSLTTPGS